MKNFVNRFCKVILNMAALFGFIACGNNSSAVNNQNSGNNGNAKKGERKSLSCILFTDRYN